MQSQVDELSPVLVAVKVVVPWDKVAKDLDQAYRKIQKTVRIRGFRPGKVPRSVVKNLMGPSVRNDVVNALVKETLANAIDAHALDPVAIPEVSPDEMVEGAPFEFTAKVEVRPKIPEVHVDGLSAERARVRIADTDIDTTIDMLRDQNADLISPDPPRPAQAGDLLTISVELSQDGKPREDLSTKETKAQLGEGRLLPEIEHGLVGMEIGHEKTIDVTFPESYSHTDLAGKPAELTVTVKDLQEKQLPELDDEFAKDLNYESLADMRAAIRRELETRAAARAENQLREALIEKLIDANPIPVPPSLVEEQTNGMIQDFLRFQHTIGQPQGLTEARNEELRKQAERKVRGSLLFGEIARGQAITVTGEDLERELQVIAERTGQHIAKVRAEHQGERRKHVESRLLENKLLEYLLGKATITESEVDAEPADEASSQTKKTP